MNGLVIYESVILVAVLLMEDPSGGFEPLTLPSHSSGSEGVSGDVTIVIKKNFKSRGW